MGLHVKCLQLAERKSSVVCHEGRADLHGQGVSSMAASIDDVERRHWQNLQHHCTAHQILTSTQQPQNCHCDCAHDELETCRASLVNVEQSGQIRMGKPEELIAMQ